MLVVKPNKLLFSYKLNILFIKLNSPYKSWKYIKLNSPYKSWKYIKLNSPYKSFEYTSNEAH